MLLRAIAGVFCVLAVGCAHREIPQDLTAIPRRESPAQPKKVAILPLLDARTAADGSDEAEAFEYRGVEYLHTALNEMAGDSLNRLTELVAQYLATARVFDQVILVYSADQAPEADLILQGKLRRMRGYVEAIAPDKKSGRPPNERYVLAEVFLEDLELRDAHDPKKLLMRIDAGWSIDEKRIAPPELERDPWPILGEAFTRAMTDLSQELARADLSGNVLVKDRVALAVDAPEDAADPKAAGEKIFGALAESPPEGWAMVRSSTATKPLGWKSTESRCAELRFEQKQTVRFSRVLGPYRPLVILSACPKDQRLSYDMLEEFPARYLGTRADGTNYFLRTLGESNWPNVLDEIRGHLAITPPKGRYNFEVGGGS